MGEKVTKEINVFTEECLGYLNFLTSDGKLLFGKRGVDGMWTTVKYLDKDNEKEVDVKDGAIIVYRRTDESDKIQYRFNMIKSGVGNDGGEKNELLIKSDKTSDWLNLFNNNDLKRGDEFILIEKDKKWNYVNRKGELVWKKEVDDWFDSCYKIEGNCFKVMIRGEDWFISSKGKAFREREDAIDDALNKE